MLIRYSSHEISTKASHSVDRTDWQAKMDSITFEWQEVMRTGPMGLVRITSWYPEFNGSHFGLPALSNK